MQSDIVSGKANTGKGRPLWTAVLAGLVLIVALGGWMLTRESDTSHTITEVSSADASGAINTLTPDAAQQARSDPQSCRYPMGYLLLSTPGNPAGGTVRVRTSKYQSPSFQITDQPQRIAIPIPVPPETGGLDVMTVEGNATGLVVSLYPPAEMNLTGGPQTINVWWTPRKACKP